MNTVLIIIIATIATLMVAWLIDVMFGGLNNKPKMERDRDINNPYHYVYDNKKKELVRQRWWMVFFKKRYN